MLECVIKYNAERCQNAGKKSFHAKCIVNCMGVGGTSVNLLLTCFLMLFVTPSQC